ncbi:hypothetical protein VP01_15605g1 [Puccinia sorghi]|uniref:Uncharacterized protein n=1 Tax=Puccinia sorghi TaxID=27349 RepID=A0A0L6VI00_9BASI|nr:hypothetical protein VP01_15605g1 [Puccinia sorghi]
MAITTMIARRGQVSLILPYSISLNLVCDVNKKFTSYLAGYPDSYVFSNMQITQQPEKFFDQNQFLLADSSDQFMLPAYKGKEYYLTIRISISINILHSHK